MLELVLSSDELYDEVNNQFIPPKHYTVQLEHSLISISKWEMKWHKPYLSPVDKTQEENLYYIECMIVTQHFNFELLSMLNNEHIAAINEYINNPMTATTIGTSKSKGGKKSIITSEVIYYYMTVFKIPAEYQKWHLSRLTTLIRVCEANSQQDTKVNPREVMDRNTQLNEARRKQCGSKG